MKRAYLVIIIFISLNFSALAQQAEKKGYNFTIGYSTGMISGTSEEIVYWDSGTNDKLSQLLWDIKPLSYVGLDLHFIRKNPQGESNNSTGFFSNFFTNVSMKFGIPGNTGYIEDRDWMNPSNLNYVTHFSVHNNFTKAALLIDIDIGKLYSLNEKIRIKPFISYSYMYYSWAARGGYGEYDKYFSGNYEHHDFPPDDDMILYKQNWHIFSPGISMLGDFNKNFNIEVYFKISPAVYVVAKDTHLYESGDIAEFTDYMNGGFFFEPRLLLSLKVNSLLTFSFSYSYRNISKARGDTEIVYSYKDPGVSYNTGGAAYSAHQAGLMAKINIEY